jgi:hypothetical protein
MWLTYNDTCPDEYQPPGFIAASKDEFLKLDDSGAFDAGDIDTGYHQ